MPASRSRAGGEAVMLGIGLSLLAYALFSLHDATIKWAFVLGYAIWGDIPRPAVFAGAFLILGAGLLLVGAERRLLSLAPTPELNPTMPPLQVGGGRRTGRSR